MRIPVVFYRADSGAEPVRDWLKALPAVERHLIGQDLWEVRSTLPGNRIARVLFCVYEEKLVILQGLIKKTANTPPGDLELARKRMKEVKR